MSASILAGRLAALTAVLLLSWLPVAGQSELKVGYATLTPTEATSAPIGTALFTFRDGAGVLVSQAGVSAVQSIASGRVFVDQAGTRTAIAVLNTGTTPAALRIELRDNSGDLVDTGQRQFSAGQHLALFADELFPGLPAGFVGSLTFSSEDQIARWAAVTLRQSLNQSGQPIFATLPVASTDTGENGPEAVVFPQVGAGAGLSTQIVLINPTAVRLTGRLELQDSEGNPLKLELGGSLASQFPIAIEENGVARLQLRRTDGQVGVGYATVTTDQGVLPGGTAIFQFTAPGGVISEAGVAAAPRTRRIRLFVDNAGTRTGVALANPGAAAATTLFRLMDRNQQVIESRTRALPAGGHLAIFADEIFPDLPEGFTGLLEIESESELAPVTLKLTLNSRGEPILTTLPVLDLDAPVPSTSLFFPQVGFGLGFSTRLILMNAELDDGVNGQLSFSESDGSPLAIPIGGTESSQVSFDFGPGESRQFYPGETAGIAEILIDPANLTVNQGSSVPLRPITLDEAGNPRDDFLLNFESLNPETVTVDDQGRVTALNRGFSTLLVSSGEVLRRFTVTSGTISAGAGGFQARDVAQDFSGSIYLANSQGHTILRAEDLEAMAEVYAGAEDQPGLQNGPRLQSRFDSPRALAANQGVGGELYVADSDNNVIRIVRRGADSETATLAGRLQAGSQDGPGSQAGFRNPGGVALDDRGTLWVCDTGNHSIRRIRLQDGFVTTVAGLSGTPGNQDGTGTQARFRSPSGIVFESETLAQQLIREQTGAPPPPTSVIVADSGNGTLRRVYEDGRVTTVSTNGSAATAFHQPGFKAQQGEPYRFSGPRGLAVDPFGNIYVSEADSGQVKVILADGQISLAAERETFISPGGMAITIRGRILVAEDSRAVQQIRYAGPSITSVEPALLLARGGQTVTVHGRNFAPESLVIIGGVPLPAIEFIDTQTIRSVTPELPSGRQTLTVHHRGGLAQAAVELLPVSVDQLSPGEITTVAGGTSDVGDGSQATSATLERPGGVTVVSSGRILVADSGSHRVRQVEPVSQIIHTVAGSGQPGRPVEGTPALVAALGAVAAVVPDADENLVIADSLNHQVYRVSNLLGRIELLAGTGSAGFSGDFGPARSAQLNVPAGVAIDGDGNIFIADSGNHRVRRIAGDGTIATVAGTGIADFSGDGGEAALAHLDSPGGLAFLPDGSLLISDAGNHRVRRIGPDGTIETVAGNGIPGFLGDGGAADSARLDTPAAVASDADGSIFIADSGNHRIRQVTDGRIDTVAGTGLAGFAGDQGPGTAADLDSPIGLALDGSGRLLIADAGNDRIRELNLATGTIRTVAGSGPVDPGDGGAATLAVLSGPRGLALGQEGLLVAEAGGHRIRQIAIGSLGAPTGLIETIAGTGEPGDRANQSDPLTAQLNQPSALSLLPDNSLLIADTENHRVRKLKAGQFSLVAGTGAVGYDGDFPATLARLNLPLGVAADLDGGVLIADSANHRIRKVDTYGYIGPLVGNGSPGFSGDGGSPYQASLYLPRDLLVAPDGRIFISDTGNHRIRVVDASRNRISTIAGTGQPGYSGDGGAASSAALNSPAGLHFDGTRYLFIADWGNHCIRVVDLDTGLIQTVAGTGQAGFGGDGGPAKGARLRYPWGIMVSETGDLLVTDQGNGRVRLVKAPLEP